MLKKIISLYILFQSSYSLAQEKKIDYLGMNYQVVSDSSTLKFSLNNKIIFAGEEHNQKGKYELKLFFIKSLLKDTVSKYIFIFELPFNREKLINDYLVKGEKEILETIAAGGYPELKDERELFFQTLRQLWLLQPPSLKFQVKCIDIPSNQYNALSNLAVLMDQNYPGLRSFQKMVRLGNKKKYSPQKARKILQNVEKDSKIHNDVFREYLKGNYDEFMNQIKGGLIVFDSTNVITSEGLEQREQFLYENFKKIIEENQDAKFFAQFGQAHVPITYQTNWVHLKNWKSLAARLNTDQDSPVKGKVTSVVYTDASSVEEECEYFVEPIIKKEDIPLFLKYSIAPSTLFKLDGENSPFKGMAEKFQYLIINK